MFYWRRRSYQPCQHDAAVHREVFSMLEKVLYHTSPKHGTYSVQRELLTWHVRQNCFLTSWVCVLLNMCRSVSPAGPVSSCSARRLKIVMLSEIKNWKQGWAAPLYPGLNKIIYSWLLVCPSCILCFYFYKTPQVGSISRQIHHVQLHHRL